MSREKYKYLYATGGYVEAETRDEVVYRIPIRSVPQYLSVKKAARNQYIPQSKESIFKALKEKLLRIFKRET